MPAITLPASPYVNQIFTVGSKSWQWDGYVWNAYYNESVDSVYGTGADGDRVLDGTTTILGMAPTSSVYSMTQDLYFNDLTINAGVRLAPNGYRIFVKNMLIFVANASIGYTTGFSTAGSIAQGGAASTAVTHSLGGSATGLFTATAPHSTMGGTNYFQVPHQAITGYSITASGGPTFLRGGAGGASQAGGGVVIVSARYIVGPSSGTATIRAPGTAPAGGGVVIVISSAATLATNVSTVVTGQNAGTSIYLSQV